MIDLQKLGIGRLSRQTAMVGLSKLVTFGTLLASYFILSRWMERAAFGRYQQAWLYIRTISAVFLLGIPQAANYFIPGAPPEKRRGYVILFFIMLCGIGATCAAASFVFRREIAIIVGNPDIAGLIPICGLYVCFILPSYMMEPLLIIGQKVRELFCWTTLSGLLFLGAVLIWGRADGLAPLFVAFTLLALVRCVITLTRGFQIYTSTRWSIAGLANRTFYAYIGFLAAIAFVDILTVEIDKYLVSHHLGEESFALYGIGAMEVPFVMLLLGAVTSIVMPELTRLLTEKNLDMTIALLHRSMEKLALFVFPTFFFAFLSSHVFIPLFFGRAYTGSVVIFCIYLFMMPLRVLNLHPYLLSAGLQRHALTGRLFDFAVNLTLGLMLIRWVGLAGPAISTVAGTWIQKVYQTRVACKHLELPLRKIYPWKQFGKIALGTEAAA
ncbi:MAG TPA: oligosaccharide flippase family protein, partial [Candidatus Sumerlaeota bacterium]|nr:oligosaccharide flippase family protein [Candidatus Sumerlaeota bacterium]